MGLIADFIGAGVDMANTGINYAQTERDFVYQQMLNQQAQANWEKEFNYTKQMNDQAQANWQAQMDFQKMQAGQQQANFEKQFNANRIGNLTKEYADAGLNPFLASGMGASTASASPVGGGGSANFSTPHGGANTKLIPNRSNEIKMQNMALMGQLAMAENLNSAQVKELESQANRNDAEAEAIRGERKELTESQVKEINAKIDSVIQDIAESKAREKNINAHTAQVELENEVLETKAIEARFQNDLIDTVLDNLTPWQRRQLQRKQYQSLKAIIEHEKIDANYTKSQTFKTYNDSICKDAQTILNAFALSQGQQQINLNAESVQNQLRRTETENFYYDQQGKRHVTGGYVTSKY